MSWEIPTRPIRLDPASSDVVVVRHGGQRGLRGVGQLIACMPYLVRLSGTVADLVSSLSGIRTGPPLGESVGVGLGCQGLWHELPRRGWLRSGAYHQCHVVPRDRRCRACGGRVHGAP